ncbi:MAG: DMT family transporter, partial [Planctomycetes bacterium]|nr:DMT family transporter [Planctomycetota bacterium]
MMCISTLCFAGMGACVKYLAADYPLPQIVWARYFFHLLLVVLLVHGRVATLARTRRLPLQLLRSVLVLGATVMSFLGVSHLPLATFVSLGFVGPLLVTGLAAVLLRETVGLGRWLAVLAGFCGVLVILQPGGDGVGHAAVFPLAMACCYAAYQLLTRVIRGAAPALTSLFYTALVGAVIASAAVPFAWVAPDAQGWLLMILTAVLGG